EFAGLGGADRRAGFAIDDVLLLFDADFAVLVDAVRDGHKRQFSRPSFLSGNISDHRLPASRLADQERLQEAHAGAGKHAPRQLDRRHKAAALWVAVETETRLRNSRQEEEPLP